MKLSQTHPIMSKQNYQVTETVDTKQIIRNTCPKIWTRVCVAFFCFGYNMDLYDLNIIITDAHFTNMDRR